MSRSASMSHGWGHSRSGAGSEMEQWKGLRLQLGFLLDMIKGSRQKGVYLYENSVRTHQAGSTNGPVWTLNLFTFQLLLGKKSILWIVSVCLGCVAALGLHKTHQKVNTKPVPPLAESAIETILRIHASVSDLGAPGLLGAISSRVRRRVTAAAE